MKKFIKHCIGLIGMLLFVALFAVPAGDILSLNFLLVKALNLVAVLVLNEVYKIIERREELENA